MNIFWDETIKIHNQRRINVLKCHKIDELFFKTSLVFSKNIVSGGTVRFQTVISEMKY